MARIAFGKLVETLLPIAALLLLWISLLAVLLIVGIGWPIALLWIATLVVTVTALLRILPLVVAALLWISLLLGIPALVVTALRWIAALIITALGWIALLRWIATVPTLVVAL